MGKTSVGSGPWGIIKSDTTLRTWESKNPQWCRLELDNFPAFANEYEVFVDRRPPPRALERFGYNVELAQLRSGRSANLVSGTALAASDDCFDLFPEDFYQIFS